MSENEKKSTDRLYDQTEAGWRALIEAAQTIQDAANQLKKTEQSIDGYNIERALLKHKPALMAQHLEGLLEHRKEMDS